MPRKFPFWTAVFLVLLRLAIGWHFGYEGYHKVHSLWLGETTTNKPFSSAGYFREAHGPLGAVVQGMVGDPDDELLAKLTFPQPKNPDGMRLDVPSALAGEWDGYFARFVDHYGLNEEQQNQARTKLRQAKDNYLKWLTTDSSAVTKTYPSGTVDVTEPNSQRVEEFQRAVRQLREVYTKELPAFGRDVEKARLQKMKADVAGMRKSLTADLDTQTANMKKLLAEVLTDAQKKADAPADPPAVDRIHDLDVVTAWFLLAVGVTLLFGLFTRTSCVLAAGFLLMTYLSTPALPWLPVPPNQEGSYFFVSKNVIEMLALLTLATTPSGRWFGIDAILHQIGRAMFGSRPVILERELVEA